MEWVVPQVLRDCKKWGVRETAPLTLKSDGEPALVDLLTDVAEERARGVTEPGRTLIEQAPKGESSSNGFIEIGVKTLEGIVRTLWLHLGHLIDEPLDVHHPVFAWLVEHPCDKTLVGEDGKTAY